jgi:F-type H+-transporting ATPase subunit delta
MVKVIVTTARELAKTEVAAIEKQLLKKYPTGIKLELLVDPKVLGGIKLNMGTEEVDATVSASLHAVKQQLLKV